MASPRLVPPIADPAPASSNWIATTAKRAGLAGAESLRLTNEPITAKVWEVAARVLGLSEAEFTVAIGRAANVRVADLGAANRHAMRLVSERLARRHHVFPISETDRAVVVATSDPFDLGVEQDLEFAAGRRVQFELASPHAIEQAIDEAYSPDRAVETLLSSVNAKIEDDVRVIADDESETISARDVETGPVVRLTSLIIASAVRQRASDIHMEPGPRTATVRFRIDGVLRHHMDVPVAVINRIISRVKVLARLDIADRLRPQDGRTRLQVDGVAIDLRVSTIPTRDSEKAVIRLLRPDTARTLDDMGVAPRELTELRQLISHRDGIVIVTGPTGSGKTTTIYAAIREIVADGTVNLMTVEDPIEYELAGVTQMQVEPKRNVTFPNALRAILRQDPDVIFVGEIRDLETAEVAVQASLTGHLVLATLHTNDAVGAVSRLADLGIDRSSLAETLRGCIGQRLVRRLCPDCAEPVADALTARESELAERLGTAPVMRAVGCEKCGNTGYFGRMPVDEVITFTPSISELVSCGASGAALQRAAAAAGTRSLREVALALVTSGVTALEEVDRVLGDAGAEFSSSSTPQHAGANPGANVILVVDDDPIQRLMVTAVLEASGFAVIAAENGIEGLELLSANPTTSLIVTDLDMPRMDGATFLTRVRQNAQFSALPMIVLTGSEDLSKEFSLMDNGADDYLRKPADPQRLMARVRAVLRRSAPAEVVA